MPDIPHRLESESDMEISHSHQDMYSAFYALLSLLRTSRLAISVFIHFYMVAVTAHQCPTDIWDPRLFLHHDSDQFEELGGPWLA